MIKRYHWLQTTESTEEFAVILSPASMRCADISAIALTVCQFVGAFGEVHNVLVYKQKMETVDGIYIDNFERDICLRFHTLTTSTE